MRTFRKRSITKIDICYCNGSFSNSSFQFSAKNFICYHLWYLELRLEIYFEAINSLNFIPEPLMLKYFNLDCIIKLIEVEASMEEKDVNIVMNSRIQYMRKLYIEVSLKNLYRWRTVDLILCIKRYSKVFGELSIQVGELSIKSIISCQKYYNFCYRLTKIYVKYKFKLLWRSGSLS